MRIAYILLTNGLEYDDRIRKEMFSMRELLNDVEFKIFGFHGDNHSETGTLSYGVPYELVSLKNRGGKQDTISELKKEYDLYSQINKKIKDYDLLWVCDEVPFFFPLFSNKPVIWDLHELPAAFMGSRFKALVFHRMERRCKWLIHANQERLDLLINNGVIKQFAKNLVLRNYPDLNWIAGGSLKPDSFKKFQEWLGEDEYIYIQGINNEARFPRETLSAVMEAKNLKAVVIGNVSDEIKEYIDTKYPDSRDYIYFAGQMIQSDTAAYMANCKFSIVLYNVKTPNNRYCEPNRMFQSLGLGKPVIVGCNEPMRNVVDKYGNGVVLPSEGSLVQDITDGIKTMIDNYAKYEENAKLNKCLFAWESQTSIFKKLFDC